MYKGIFRTDTFNEDNPQINMDQWVEPTLYNTGTAVVYLNGIAIEKGASFILGPSSVEMNGTIALTFSEEGKKEVKVNYVLLQKQC